MSYYDNVNEFTRVTDKMTKEVLALGDKPSKVPGYMQEQVSRAQFRARWEKLQPTERGKLMEEMGVEAVMDALATSRGAEAGLQRPVKPVGGLRPFGEP